MDILSHLFCSTRYCLCVLFYLCCNGESTAICVCIQYANFCVFIVSLQEQEDPRSASWPDYYIERINTMSSVSNMSVDGFAIIPP